MVAGLSAGVFSIDATSIDLCLSLFPWAKFRTRKGAVKIHTVLENTSSLPVFAQVTDGKCSDVRGLHETILPDFPLPPGSVVALDRGYCDYTLWHNWTRQGVWFVSRMKDTSGWRRVLERDVPAIGSEEAMGAEIRRDLEIELCTKFGHKKCPDRLRLVTVWDEKTKREFEFVTNNLEFTAGQVAAIYRDRWQIELLFKKIKQNLQIKSFVGTSANAVKIQIYSALSAVLLTEILRAKARKQLAILRQEREAMAEAADDVFRTAIREAKASLAYSNFIALLRLSLFAYRDLTEWLANPFGPPKAPETPSGLGPLFGQHPIEAVAV